MNVASPDVMTHGVVCRNCGKPIRLSRSLLKRRIAAGNSDLTTKIFPARCKRCGREKLYGIDEIRDLFSDSNIRDARSFKMEATSNVPPECQPDDT